MKATLLLPSLLILTACTTTKQQTSNIIPPTILRSPDLTQLSTKSCQSGELIATPATLRLDKRGKVTDVLGLTIRDKELARQIIAQFKKAEYTPYMQNGKPIARDLDIAIRLKCPYK